MAGATQAEAARRRAAVLTHHFTSSSLHQQHSPGMIAFDTSYMRQLMDGHDMEKRDAIFSLLASSELFQYKEVGGTMLVVPDCNQTMEEHREITLKRIEFLRSKGVFKGFLTNDDSSSVLSRLAVFECLGNFDHSLGVKTGLQFNLWGGAIRFLGTRYHWDKWLKISEDFVVRGCFAMTELGHGSNVRGIETTATYDVSTQEFIIYTPNEAAQKYWIGVAANDATHAVVFCQLNVDGKHQGIHAFIVKIRDEHGSAAPGVQIADCGHKSGLNGVDNGRLWFNEVRIPRENLLNSLADVSSDGRYVSSILDPDKRFAAFMTPLTGGRVMIAINSIYKAKLGLTIAVHYTLTRTAAASGSGGLKSFLLDNPSYQHSLLPLLAKTYAMSFAGNNLKTLYVNRSTADTKAIHILSSGYKALFTWHNVKTLQECRKVCGYEGLLSENRIGQLMVEFDSQLTFEGDNTILVQQVSKLLLLEYLSCLKKKKSIKGLGLEYLNSEPPFVGNQCESSLLQSSTFQLSIFQLREHNLLQRLRREVLRRTSEGSPSFDDLTLSYRTTKDLGLAFSERSVLEAILLAEENEAFPLIKFQLGLLRSLYALSIIEENPVFLRFGYVNAKQSQAIQLEVGRLCAQIRLHALALVESFGFPKPLLGPLAFGCLNHNA